MRKRGPLVDVALSKGHALEAGNGYLRTGTIAIQVGKVRTDASPRKLYL